MDSWVRRAFRTEITAVPVWGRIPRENAKAFLGWTFFRNTQQLQLQASAQLRSQLGLPRLPGIQPARDT